MQKYLILSICVFAAGCSPSIRRSYIINNNTNAVRTAIASGADINATTSLSGYGSSASNGPLLIFAAKMGTHDIAKLLIAAGADVNAQGENGETALLEALKRGDWLIANLLMENGADIKIPNSEGETALTIAAKHNSINLIDRLLAEGSKINATNKAGMTALMVAASKNYTDLAKLLINRGADVNLKDNNNNTALTMAAENNNAPLAKILIEHGAFTHIKNSHGYSALDIAENKNYPDVVKALLNTPTRNRIKYGADPKKKNIAVANFESHPPLSASDASFITTFFQRALINTRVFNVLDRNNMDKTLAEQGFQQLGCTTAYCAVQMGKLLNVQLIIVGTCGQLFSRYILAVDIIDVETGQIIGSFKEDSATSSGIEKMVFKLADEVKNVIY
ncbi:MAG: hypothetical protein COZ15_06730 [Elusimicrobia bacterium CG_4_10_14_3_um_filter_49_12_50_7]|nr:MAG: hypothetical protein COZ15_06730 [Elusimicrobia bacterium CG_4_10_14_3_um_filter_49_12_50_7]